MAVAKAAKKKLWKTSYGFSYYPTDKALQHVDEEGTVEHELPRSELRDFYRSGKEVSGVDVRVNGYTYPHSFGIERNAYDGTLDIGCHSFTKAEAAKLKRWAIAKAVRKPARKPARKARKRAR